MTDLDKALFASMREREFVDAMRAGIDAFAKYRATMPLANRSYTRTQLRRLPHYELVAVCWAPGSRTPIHDHGISRCWVVMLDGSLDVESYERLDDANERAVLRRGESRRVGLNDIDYRADWRDMHRVGNPSEAPAYSLQLYAAPLAQYTVVQDETLGTYTTTGAHTHATYSL